MKKILTLTPLCAFCFGTDVYGMNIDKEIQRLFEQQAIQEQITTLEQTPSNFVTLNSKSNIRTSTSEESEEEKSKNPLDRINDMSKFFHELGFSMSSFLDPREEFSEPILNLFANGNDAARYEILMKALQHQIEIRGEPLPPINEENAKKYQIQAYSEVFLNVLLDLITLFTDPIEYKRALFECIDCYGRKFYSMSADKYLVSKKFNDPKANRSALIEGSDTMRLDILKASLEGFMTGHFTIHDEILEMFFMLLDSAESLTSDGDSQYLLLARYFKWNLLKQLYPKHKDAWYKTLGESVKPPHMWDIRKNKDEEIDPDTALRMVFFLTGVSQGLIKWDFCEKFWTNDFPYIVYNNMPLLSSVVFHSKADFLPDTMKQVMKKAKFDVSTGLLEEALRNDEFIYPLLAIALRDDTSSNLNTLYASFLDLMDEGATGTALCKLNLEQVAKYFPSLNPEFVKNFKEDPSTHYIKVNAFGAMQLLYSPLFQKILSSENLSAEFFSVTHGIQLNDGVYFPSWILLFSQNDFEMMDELIEKYPQDEFSYISLTDKPHIARFFTKLPVISTASDSFKEKQQGRKSNLALHLMENDFFNLRLISNANSYLFDAQAKRFICSFQNTAREMDFSEIFEILVQSEPFVNEVFTSAIISNNIPLLSFDLENSVKEGDLPGVHLLLTIAKEKGFSIIDKDDSKSNLLDMSFIQPQDANLQYLRNIQMQKGISKEEKQENMRQESVEREQTVNDILHLLGINDHDLETYGDFKSYRERINSKLIEHGAKSLMDQETADQTNDKPTKQPNKSSKGKKKKWQDTQISSPVASVVQAPKLMTEKPMSSTEANSVEKPDSPSEKEPKQLSRKERRALEQQGWKSQNKEKKKKANKKNIKTQQTEQNQQVEEKLSISNSEPNFEEKSPVQNPIPEISEKSQIIVPAPTQIEDSNMIPSSEQIMIRNASKNVSNNQNVRTPKRAQSNHMTTSSQNNTNDNPNVDIEGLMRLQESLSSFNPRPISEVEAELRQKREEDRAKLESELRRQITEDRVKMEAELRQKIAENQARQEAEKPSQAQKPTVVYVIPTELDIDKAGNNLTPEMMKRMLLDSQSELDLAEKLRHNQKSLRYTAKNGQNIIHYLVKHGTLKELKSLLRSQHALFIQAMNHQDIGGWISLHLAAKYNEEIYNWLRQIGADATIRDQSGNNPEDIRRYYLSKK